MRSLIEFDGSVNAQRGSGAVGLSLRGEARYAPPPAAATARQTASAASAARVQELLFSGVAQIEPPVPPSLHAVRVLALDAEASVACGERLFRIEAREGQYIVRARGVQLHAETNAPFFAVLPRTRVTPLTRWGWSALLSLLRVLPLVRRAGRRRR
jgi:hypothetical protein